MPRVLVSEYQCKVKFHIGHGAPESRQLNFFKVRWGVLGGEEGIGGCQKTLGGSLDQNVLFFTAARTRPSRVRALSEDLQVDGSGFGRDRQKPTGSPVRCIERHYHNGQVLLNLGFISFPG